jgi:hypothetical protein
MLELESKLQVIKEDKVLHPSERDIPKIEGMMTPRRSIHDSPIHGTPVGEMSGILSVKAIEDERKTEITFQHDNFWKSCCGCNVDKRLVTYFTRSFFALVVLTFSMYMILTLRETDDDTAMYWGAISGIIGAYLGPGLVNLDHDK